MMNHSIIEYSPEVLQDLGVQVHVHRFGEERVAEDLLNFHAFFSFLAHCLQDEVLGSVGDVDPLGESDFVGNLE